MREEGGQNILHVDPKAHTFGLLLNLNKIEGPACGSGGGWGPKGWGVLKKQVSGSWQ